MLVVSFPPVSGTIGVAALLPDAVGAIVFGSLLLELVVGVALAQADRASTQIAMSTLKIVFRFISCSIPKDEMEYSEWILERCEEDMSFL